MSLHNRRKHETLGFPEMLVIIKILQNYRKSLKAFREAVAVAWQGFSPHKISFSGVETP